VIATRTRRPVAATFLVAATIFAALLPPAHIHLGADHDDHDHTAGIEHSHWSAHHASRAAFDDEDGRVLFVDHPALVRAAHAQIQPPDAILVARLPGIDSQAFTSSTRQLAGNAPRDGPPRDIPTLRGPPFVL
jgi:hypothetical protein